MKKSKEGVSDIFPHRNNLKIRLIWEAALIGLLTGLVIVANRVLVEKLSPLIIKFYTYSKGHPLTILLVFVILGLMGFFVGCLVKKDPMISGSGIPQVEGILMKRLEVNWLRVLVFKFIGGTAALIAGLSVGREGPSVQMGAAIGQGFSKVCKRINIEDKFLITSGASAGLSGAFNAPLSGVIFALEEVHKNFSPLVLLSAMSASIAADFMCKNFLGLKPALGFSDVSALPLKYYWTLCILGIILGFTGVLFSKGILKTQDIYGIFKKVPIQVKVMIPFLCAGVVGITAPILLGGGHSLIMSLGNGRFTITMLFLFLLIKYIFTFVSFGSGTPGGIFFPLLVLGAIVGNIFGIIVCKSAHIPTMYIINFVIFAMAGHFASIVKAPITGIVLITEMSGSFEHLLALTIVVIFSYVTSDILKSEPIYESLLERSLKKYGKDDDGDHKAYPKKTILEISVFMGSTVEGHLIKDIEWPEECLLVGIKRGGKEIIPNGDTEILAGDFLVVLVDDDKAAGSMEALQKLSTEIKE
ncbi:MAG: chloride channel protein [Clostridium baratii]|uniref:Voltage gated chloride channel family protein n=1 Tax=Clostridium baratii str. Sullivan TaxID=1415775 RepID=A0A0A7FUN5_9CLOT|nr:ClC family H(+)/Cl(-) exchange transporter [Clostridium baratii]AIY83324.1 voltage gated chloride channel family protein [Clostridium baratii str. Sullivan]MBS6005840.1 chloride channel protein [Clostridium baratii]MDU1052909.1 chloride channel protein [Clostridium baratii]MDU4912353.1 chloride channel protein [Clostridium baratii]CUP21099.1 voltage-gated chloride channel family protein [Clostridium baratii]